ncbi:MAG: CpaF/VirB11 family protein [Oscillospiraceae bacterium]|nr:CpaF/VirB11 family protein [Oscillospiraceae bacterium]
MLGECRSQGLGFKNQGAEIKEQYSEYNLRKGHAAQKAANNAKGSVAPRSHDLFFTADSGGQEFGDVLRDVQEYISSKHSTLILDGGNDDVKEQVKRYITKYVQDYRIAVAGMTSTELIDTLYTEMAEFGFLTKYIFGTGIEEINLNSWNDIVVHYSDGRVEKINERFDSPHHGINVVRRMLHTSGIVLDNASPTANASLSKNIRIAALKTPVVDDDVGIAASIRIVNPQRLQKDDFVRGGTATAEMLDFLTACLRYGASICVAGATGSGKTTVAGWMLTTIPDHLRLFTIENGSRELDLVRYDENNNVRNNVIHTITHYSDNEAQCITQENLLDMALRFHPDIICVGEMRSAEAYAAQEAGRTGHTLLTTIHSNSAEATHYRMMTLCKRAHEMKDETLMALVAEAFPIIVFAKQLEDKSRKIMQIMECEMTPDGQRKYHSLYKYNIKETRFENNRFIIDGQHIIERPISESLEHKFLENGMPQNELEKLKKGRAKK